MKKLVKNCLIIFAMAVTILAITEVKSNASYSINTINIDANINEDGSLDVKEKIEYNFSNKNYEISINIPKELSDIENESIIYDEDEKKIDLSSYTANSLKINEIYVEDSKDKPFKYTKNGYGGMNNAYTLNEEGKAYIVKLYKSSFESKKAIVIDYTLENICKNHNDYGELYYNFVGNDTIGKLDINLYLPKKNKAVFTWKHGSVGGKYKIISNSHINYSYKNIRLGEYTAIRVLFDKKCISNSENYTGINSKDIIFKAEDKILNARNKRNIFESCIYVLSLILVIYAVYVFYRIIKRKDDSFIEINDEEISSKYNEILLGCIKNNRSVLVKDIIASILKMINLGCINLKIEDDNYIISKNNEKIDNIKKIDKEVIDIVFESKEEVNLKEFINEINKDNGSFEKIEKLDKKVKSDKSLFILNIFKMKYLKAIIDIVFSISSIVLAIVYLKYNVSNIVDVGSYLFIDNIRFLLYLSIAICSVVFIIMNLRKMFKESSISEYKSLSKKKMYTLLGIILGFSLIIIFYSCLMPFARYLSAIEILLGANLITLVLDSILLKDSIENNVEYKKVERIAEKVKEFFANDENYKDNNEKIKEYLPYEICLFDSSDVLKKISKIKNEDILFKVIKNLLVKEEK